MQNEDIKEYQLETEIMYYLVSRFPHGITKTRLLKLFYLVDFFSKKNLDEKITKFVYNYYYYGPFSEYFIETLNSSKGYEITEITKAVNNLELIYLYFKGGNPRISDDMPSLKNKKKREIIEDVLDQYGSLGFKEMMSKVYETDPMKKKSFGDKNIL